METMAGTVTVESWEHADNVSVFSGRVVPSITLPGIGVPLETVPGMVEGSIVIPGTMVVPGMYPEMHVGAF